MVKLRNLCARGARISEAYEAFPGFSEDAVKKQYYKHADLAPHRAHDGNRAEWTAAEDDKLRAAVAEHGPRWRTIKTLFAARSDSSLRNRAVRLGLAPGSPRHPPSHAHVPATSGLPQAPEVAAYEVPVAVAMDMPAAQAYELPSRPRLRLGPSGKPVSWA